jgi:hypothetical protein
VGKRFGVEQIAFFTATRWIADHSCCSTSKHDRPVAEHLESTQTDLAQQVAHVQGI